MDIHENEEGNMLASLTSALSIAVAVNGSRNSKCALSWALEKFIPEGRTSFKLLFVRPKITAVPTAMGNFIPVSNVREDIVAAYKKEIEWETSSKLHPFKQMCAQRQVAVEISVLEAEDVAQAISEEIAKSEIHALVIGSSSRSIISRKFGRHDVSKRISGCIPNFCTVYVISKGKLLHIHPANSGKNKSSVELKNDGFSTKTEWSGAGLSCEDLSCEDLASYSPSLLDQCDRTFSTLNCIVANRKLCSVDVDHSRGPSLVNSEGFISSSSGHADLSCHVGTSASESFLTESESWIFDQTSESDGQTDVSSTAQLDLNLELEKLRIELRHAQSLFSVAQEEVADASQKVTDLHIHKMNEANKFKEIRYQEKIAIENALCERKKREAAEAEAKFAKQSAKNELLWRRAAEIVAANEMKQKHVLEKTLEKVDQTYKKFSWKEIVSASSSFSDSIRIGSGAYGTVYKCKFHHTTAAVKVLQLDEGHKTKQFQRELEILSRIRHPHLLLLLGACPEHGCLVYEYMENGSLDDRLFRKNNTPPLCWSDRFRIAWEIASALLFLHTSKPKPIVHRDLKPANILLDHNFVSKIGDVGLCTLLPTDHATTVFNNTALAGTLCYIDPEYQRTGLVSPKSDIYAFGMIILQLLTAKPPMALAHLVETALLEGKLQEILDGSAGEWPLKETQELAALGLSCVELRRSDRSDLKDDILPILERLKDIPKFVQDSMGEIQKSSPSHFLCPILKEVMQDPCIAADGYTYERRAIERWLRTNDKSPMSNLPFPSKALLPNYTLLAAIAEWRSKNP
ncbi:U-box domain-containing protein 35-like isoform X1 [Nymphaea colorata]|uniref:U-box domain-containing protein 35-like isoform X1 n=2 Tax=Nymphaea colorata TaxID=210225 RepID=UPI00129D67DC|nr:U-box domain-containing protein 35-like isoform X1 [Nymphaea colorata]XP_031483074.1 U-box domain-containing protein 35-like isoform X1 [Nymphaea colorata]XP_031483075.1 U-box domain-containing protein 35-like isoform X1 [Nymphaea colorata]XP_031483076.1 U-box domain-containing protein 35-like isoform X1 [Nymphaea colorata]XP_049933443.1 U-box domain-containing protein 35-like isoform X1 [Nymphaea colorata]